MQPQRRASARPGAGGSGLAGSDVARLAGLVSRGEVSAVEVLLAHLARIAEVDAELNALVRVDAGPALRSARAIDRRRDRGTLLGPLAGVPFVVKDNVDVRRQGTTAGSRAAADVVALHDAPVVGRLRAAGAVLVGRANMDEFAMGASTRTSVFGATRNPWDPARSPGGSSGGSAAAVAAGMAAFAVGTDTGGSIREPAAQCGVVGLAPSPGLVPLTGVLPFAPAFDRVGPLAQSPRDVATLLRVMSGRRAPRAGGAAPRVGLVRELSGTANQTGVRERFAAAVHDLRTSGIDVVEVSLPDAPRALGAYMTITSVDCIPHLERFAATGRAGAEVGRRLELGRALLGSPELASAREVRDRLATQAAAALGQCTAMLSPTMPTTAPTWDSIVGTDDLTDPLSAPYTDCWTVVANLTGLPALSVPVGLSPADGMPVGAMLSGAAGSDADLLALAGRMLDASDPVTGQSVIATLLG